MIEPAWLWPKPTMRPAGAKRCPAASSGLPAHFLGLVNVPLCPPLDNHNLT